MRSPTGPAPKRIKGSKAVTPALKPLKMPKVGKKPAKPKFGYV
jgi:hypothetical protein